MHIIIVTLADRWDIDPLREPRNSLLLSESQVRITTNNSTSKTRRIEMSSRQHSSEDCFRDSGPKGVPSGNFKDK
ncbi:hypothetical protein LCGC14_0235040 [marine sediment metagenome]|uniref:Uncharacterized protein n=1 Tax=marine sediment metagenome TaxID=412755 RepID=A0A0F9XD13_9ZZZZ